MNNELALSSFRYLNVSTLSVSCNYTLPSLKLLHIPFILPDKSLDFIPRYELAPDPKEEQKSI